MDDDGGQGEGVSHVYSGGRGREEGRKGGWCMYGWTAGELSVSKETKKKKTENKTEKQKTKSTEEL